MSIVRIGLAETKKFAEGYEAIFGKKNSAPEPEKRAAVAQKARKKKKPKKAKKK
jgi:hypothetical protein